MNGDGVPDYDPVTQDLYLYDATNTGYPTGWNPNCVVYKYRDQLETRRAKPRQFFNSNNSYPPPVGVSLSQKPNYYNNLGNGSETAPFMWVNSSRGIWCCHYWLGGLFDRKRSLVPPDMTYLGHTLYFLNLNNQLIELEKTNLLSGWTYVGNNANDINSRKMPQDMAIVEYSGTKLQGKKFPKFGVVVEMAPDTFDTVFMIDSQDKVLSLIPNSSNFNIEFVPFDQIELNYISIRDPRILLTFNGDSGMQLYGVRDNVVYFLGHVSTGSAGGLSVLSQTRHNSLSGNKFWVPDWNYVQIEQEKIPPPKNTAKQITLLEMKSKLNEIKNILTGLNT